tara:strand:+ start:409 stop:720 length:312 start_codon:yes stop_codon:yes gene_type:complete
METQKEKVADYLKYFVVDKVGETRPYIDPDDIELITEGILQLFDLSDVGQKRMSIEIWDIIWDIMSDSSISKNTYNRLGELHDKICDPVNRGNWPLRIDITYV